MSPTVSCPAFQELYVIISVSYGPISMFLRNGWGSGEVSNTHAHTNNSHKQPSLKHDFITITHAKRNFHMILSSLTKGARKLQRRVCMHAKATISLLHGIIVSYHLTHTNTCTWSFIKKAFCKNSFPHFLCLVVFKKILYIESKENYLWSKKDHIKNILYFLEIFSC